MDASRYSLLSLFLCSWLLSCAGTPAAAPDAAASSAADAAAPPASAPADETYKPAPPLADDFDWVRTTSGEWVKGEITVMRRDSLEFDSDEFDDLAIDWEDVAEVRSPRRNSVVVDQRTVVLGTVRVTEDEVIVLTDEGEQRFERSRVRSIVPGEPKEINYWAGKINIGLSNRSGNVDQTDFSAIAGLTRRTPLTRLTLDYNGAISMLDDKETANNHRATGKFDIFLSKRLYVFPIVIDYYRDRFQNVDHRLVPGAGFGIHVVDTKRLEWDIEAGGAARYEKYISVEPGQPSEELTGAVLVGTTFDLELTKRLDLLTNYTAQIGIDSIHNTNQHLGVVFEFELTDILDLDLAFYWDRTGEPKPLADGTVPERDDFRTHIGIGVDF